MPVVIVNPLDWVVSVVPAVAPGVEAVEGRLVGRRGLADEIPEHLVRPPAQGRHRAEGSRQLDGPPAGFLDAPPDARADAGLEGRALEADHASLGWHRAEDAVEERRLARPVVPHHHRHVPFRHVEIYIAEGDPTASVAHAKR